MNIIKTPIAGAYILELEKKSDSRGFLARWWDLAALNKHGVEFSPVEGYTCMSLKKGTLRGFHYVVLPAQETKLTRVIQGSLFEVIVDLRPSSQTYLQTYSISIKAEDYKLFLTPPGCAHAVLTLKDNTEYMSLYSPKYNPEIERGIRFDDPKFTISWPIPIQTVSEKDRQWKDFHPEGNR